MGKVALTYTSHTDTTNGSSTKDSRTIYDIGGYYKFSGGGWVLGALYQNDSRGGDTSINRTSYGVSGGWMAPRDSGFFLIGTYFVSSTYGDFKDGNGYQADLGYKFTPGNIPIAMQISYKNYEYSKYNHSDTFIDPYFVIILDF
ncbi:MAG TPA: hypothetical protein VN132_09580 [Bdellovibrio sp.]|nr:hypothetical protein [Bdellovibrio sp.]